MPTGTLTRISGPLDPRVLIEGLELLVEFIKGKGGKLPHGSLIPNCLEHLRKIDQGDDVAIDKRAVYLTEALKLVHMFYGFNKSLSKERFKYLTKGCPVYPTSCLEEKAPARHHMRYQLYFASYLSRGCCRDISVEQNLIDVQGRYNNTAIFVECKRLFNAGRIGDPVKDAWKKSKSFGSNSNECKVIAFDVSPIFVYGYAHLRKDRHDPSFVEETVRTKISKLHLKCFAQYYELWEKETPECFRKIPTHKRQELRDIVRRGVELNIPSALKRALNYSEDHIEYLFKSGSIPSLSVWFDAPVPYRREDGILASKWVSDFTYDGRNNATLMELQARMERNFALNCPADFRTELISLSPEKEN